MAGRELGPLFTVPEDGREPAFPVNGATGWYRGMALRDYFAAKAMQAYLQKAATITAPNTIEWIVGNSYRIAEAMMREREKDND